MGQVITEVIIIPTGQNYSSVATLATLTAGISNSATACTVNSVSGFPTAPFTIAIDPGQANQELCDVTNVTGTTLTITRAVDGSSAQAHSNNAVVMHAGIGRDFREFRNHVDASASNDASSHAVHGLQVGSSVVGTTDTQTLAGKTLTSPTINSPAINTPTIIKPVVGSSGVDEVQATVLRGTDTTPAVNILNIQNAANSATLLGVLSDGSVNTNGTYTAGGAAGARTSSRYAGGTAGGPPTTGTFLAGDLVVDTKWGITWTCVSGGTPGTWQGSGPALFSEIILGSAGGFDWASIPSYFRHLHVKLMGVSTATGGPGFDDVTCRFNADAGSDYSYHFIYIENNTTVSAVGTAAQTVGRAGSVANGNTNPTSSAAVGHCVIDIPYYAVANTSKELTFSGHASSGIGSPNNYHYGSGGSIWGNNKPAVNEVTLGTFLGTTFAAGSRASLYMIP